MKPAAVIFDMDGTLMDNNSYHFKAWQAFYKNLDKTLSEEEYKTNISGKIAKDAFYYIFQKELNADEIKSYADEKEKSYRDLYKPHIEIIPGLFHFLEELKQAFVPMVIATSGVPVNIQFVFDHLPIEKYFDAVINATHVTNGKPHPEIFLKAASAVAAEPNFCIAFEDSLSGIRSAKTAGMKVVALTTAHAKENLKEADFVIQDYTQISLSKLEQLLPA